MNSLTLRNQYKFSNFFFTILKKQFEIFEINFGKIQSLYYWLIFLPIFEMNFRHYYYAK